jgi:hypothetical protein
MAKPRGQTAVSGRRTANRKSAKNKNIGRSRQNFTHQPLIPPNEPSEYQKESIDKKLVASFLGFNLD